MEERDVGQRRFPLTDGKPAPPPATEVNPMTGIREMFLAKTPLRPVADGRARIDALIE